MRSTERPREGASEHSFRRDVQGLRAIAVLVVVAEHFFGAPSGGFVGVDVFFVLSGFLITGLLMRRQARTGTVDFIDFYRRRARRLLPAAMVTIIVTVVLAQLLFNAARASSVRIDAVWSALFAANWRFALIGSDYFTQDGPVSPLRHFWSLAVEEQFYFVWPVVILLCGTVVRRRAGRVWSAAEAVRARRLAFGAIALLSIGSFVFALWETQTAPALAYFSSFSRAWELGAGALLALSAHRLSRAPMVVRAAMAWLGLLGIGASLIVVAGTVGFPAPWALLPVLATALVVSAGIGGVPRGMFLLTNPVSVYIGNISYSLYLWHFPVLILGAAALEMFAPQLDPFVRLVVLLAVAAALAVASYHFVEEPVRNSSWLASRDVARRRWSLRHLGLAGAAGATAVVVALAIAPAALSGSSARSEAQELVYASPTASPGAEAQSPAQAALTAEIEVALTATEWPADLHPTLETVEQEELPGNTGRCGGPILPADPETCTFGEPDAPKLAVLVGDSIAQAYVPALAEVLGSGEWRLRTTSMYACPFLSTDVGLSGVAGELCAKRRATAISIITETQPDLVIVSNTYWRKADSDTGSAISYEDWDAGFDAALDQISSSAKAVVALPPPTPDNDMRECMTAAASPADCLSRVDGTDWAEMANRQRASIERIGGTFVDNRAWFCSAAGDCPAFVGSILVKKDQAHITADYARFIAPVVRESLQVAGLL